MSLRYWLYMGPDLGHVDVTERMRLGLEFEEKAEEGAVGTNTITFDDPDGDFEPHGHRSFGVEETTAIDPDDRFIAVGFIGECRIKRGPYRIGAGRQWECEVSDPNTILARTVMVGAGNDRPSETDVARIQWAEATTEGLNIDDTRYLSTDAPVTMDAADYTLQGYASIYDDCAQQSGKNYYITYFGDNGADDPDPWGYYSLWYGAAGSSDYLSTARLTNDLADIDMTTTFPLYLADEFIVDPMRIYSKVIVPYASTYVSASRQTTIDEYARRETVMNARNVKTKATALARANRYATDLATPEHLANVTTIVPRQYVNLIRPGMAVQVKATHWVEPYASTYTYMRVLSRKVVEVSESDDETFELTLSLSRSEPGPTPGPVYGILRQSQGPDTDNVVHWSFPGDSPHAGYPTQATSGLVEVITDPSPPNAGWPYSGWKVTGTGTVDVTFFATATGVLVNDTLYTITWAIRKNGIAVASESGTAQGSLQFWTDSRTVTITGLSVVPDDVIDAVVSCVPDTMPFFRTPLGTGQNGERLEITGGSLA